MDAARVQILIDTKQSGSAAAVAAVNSSFEQMVKRAQDTAAKVTAAFSGLSSTQKLMAGGAVAATLLAVGLAAVAGPAIRFESAFAGVRKTVDGTEQELEAIRVGILEMSATMPTAANELASIAEQAGQLGVATPDVLEFTRTIAMLGETTDLDFDEAAQSLARLTNITGSGAGNIEHVADVIVDLGNNSATTESQIVTFATRLASAFSSAASQSDKIKTVDADILGLAAAFSSLGIQAEAGGSSLSQIITSLADSAINGGKDLETYARLAGEVPEKFAEMIKQDPTDALLRVGAGMGELIARGESLTPILDSLQLGGLRTSEAFRLLALNNEFVRAQLERARSAWENGGQALEEYNKRLDTVQARLDTVRNRLTGFAIAIGTPALKVFADGLDIALAAMNRLGDRVGPAASQLGEFLVTSATGAVKLGAAFTSSSGLIAAAGSVLGGTVDIIGVLLGALNSLPPAALLAGGALALIANTQIGRSLALVASNAVLTGNAVGTISGAASSASAGLSGMLATLSPMTIGLIALGAAFLISSKHAADLEREARSANEGLVEVLTTAFDTKSAGGISAIREIEAEMESLDATVGRINGEGFWDQWGSSIKNAWTNIGGVSREAEVAQERLDLLNEVLADEAIENYGNRVEILAEKFGLSESAIESAIVATDSYDLATSGSVDSLLQLTAAVGAYIDGVSEVEGVSESTTQAVIEGTASIDQYAESLGVSTEALLELASTSDEVDLNALFADDDEARAEAIAQLQAMVLETAQLAGVYAELTGASSASTDAMAHQVATTEGLISAMSELRDALDQAKQAQADMTFTAENLTEAQGGFFLAMEAFKADPGDAQFDALARAMYTATAAFAATGQGAQATANYQRDLYGQLLDVALGFGMSEESARDYIARLGVIPPDVLSRIILEADEARAAAEEQVRLQKEIEGDIHSVVTADTSGANDAFAALHIQRQELDPVIEMRVNADTSSAQDAMFLLDIQAQSLSEKNPIVVIGADGAPADTVVRSLETEFVLLETRGTVVPIEADAIQALGEIERASSATDAYTGADHTATVGADITDALSKVGTAEGEANSFADADYTAVLKANADAAKTAVAVAERLASAYRTADYTATLKAEAGQAIQVANIASAHATKFATTRYLAILRADSGQAVSAINHAVSALARFQSKTVSLTVVNRNVNADGGVWPATSFAAGGMAGMVLERPGPARIYQPAAIARVFAEPVTGGESYIPHAIDKRRRSREIWEQTGRILGAIDQYGQIRRFAEGGIHNPGRAPHGAAAGRSVNLTLDMPMSINAAPGMDERALADLVGVRVEHALARVAADISNALK